MRTDTRSTPLKACSQILSTRPSGLATESCASRSGRTSWLAAAIDAARWRSLGRTVANLDGVGKAWIAGHVGGGQVRQIARARSNPRVRDQLAPFVPTLITQAEALEAADFAKLVDHTITLLDADGAHDDRHQAIEHRRANVTTIGGSLSISAFGGDALTASEMETIFERFEDAEYHRDVATRAELHPHDAEAHELPRTKLQRRHDALIAIFRAAAVSNSEGAAAGLVLNIVADADTFAAIMTEAGLTADTSVTGERVDPFAGLARPDHLIDERQRGSRESITPKSGCAMAAPPISRTAASNAVRITESSPNTDGEQSVTQTVEASPSEPPPISTSLPACSTNSTNMT